MDENIKIQNCSSKLLNYLVNDILDFSQMKSGKFRKNNINFDITDTIQEILTIEGPKAEILGINIKVDLYNFDNRRQLNT